MRTLAIRKDDRLQVTNAESHFTLPIASDVLAGMCSRDANCWAIVTNAIQTKRNKRTTAVLAVSRRVSAALPGAVPGEPPEPAEKGRGDIRRSAIARGLARFAPDGSCAIIAHNSRVAMFLGSRDSLAASSHGSTFRRANADINVERHPVLLLADQRDKKLIEFMLEEE
jgi:hypothetical protein